jgi:cobalt-precorrin 5A hydrolase/precorrin-3B C17-methyltransferase
MISYFSLTAGGTLLALKLRDRFGGSAHLPRCYSLGCRRCDPFDSIAEALPKSFEAGDAVVCIMAAGIVFRVLAPYLRSKQEDPAVIVVDEEGRHVIPLLGGHAAGANERACEIAAFLGASAAVTTASDALGLTAPDQVAGRLGAVVDDPVALRRVTALLVDGKPVCIESPADPGIEGYSWVPPGGSLDEYAGRILLDYKDDIWYESGIEGETADSGEGQAAASHSVIPTARLIPRRLAAGIGCRRGTPAAEIVEAVGEACRHAGVDPRSLAALASVTAKEDEPGLAAAASSLRTRLVFFTSEHLAALGRPGSSFVKETVGTPAVCEPAALLAAGDNAELLLGKQAMGRVTVALAVAAAATASPAMPGDAATPAGRVVVVGTGAGTEPLLTQEAAAAIRSADIILGYRTYIDQLRRIFPEKEYRSGHMGAEVDRCREALDLAAAGRQVVMVSSGDPGVYGMAGPLLEMAGDIPVSIVPGVTAAQIAAARLGAPLMNDYITLSLSDLLTPREEVLSRARLAAASDMVVCLYNPTSKKRRPLFEEVCAILAGARPPQTPAGWVRSAGGPDEEVNLTTLGQLAGENIDMRSIIIVGNSHTEIVGGKMVTRRGYGNKK